MSSAGVIDPLASPGWDDLIGRFPGASVFHSRAWLLTLAQAYGHRFAAVRLGSGEACGWLVLGRAGSLVVGRTAVSVPFADLAPPLIPDGVTGPVLPAVVLNQCRRWGCRALEIRGGPVPLPNAPSHRNFASHAIDLDASGPALWSRLSDSSRRSVRKARQCGLTVLSQTSPAAVAEYYRLHCLTRRRFGLPPQPSAFFHHLQRSCLAVGQGFVVLAGRSGSTDPQDLAGFQAMAGAVFLVHRRQAVYKYGASDERFLDHRPNHLVMWSAIEQLIASGVKSLHLGRSDWNQEGLLRYKRGWGAAESRLDYYRYDLRRGRFCPPRSSPPAVNRLLSRLPPFLLRALGRLLYPHLH